MEMKITEYPGFCRRGTKRPRDEAIEEHVETIIAKIYKWIFVPPDYMNHPLSGIPYIGQTIQSLKDRTTQHKRDARKDVKEGKVCGLHALYVEHPDSWKIEIVEERTFTGPQLNAKTAASEWMDDREKALIKEHGGKLKDMDRKLTQTLNLTDGGQRGDPRKHWQSIEAKTRKRWQEIKPLLDAFFKEHGHVNVPLFSSQKHKKLGTAVHHIRSRKSYVTTCPEIKTYLEQRNFIWNVQERRSNLIKEIILSYDNPNKEQKYVHELDPNSDLAKRWNMVRRDSEKDDEIKIGSIIRDIRKRGDLINNDPNFFEALIAKGFKMHTRDTKKNQERIAEKRELHRQKKENDLMGPRRH